MYINDPFPSNHKLARRTPRPGSVCGSPRLCRRRERCLIGTRFGRWRGERFGRYRCLTSRYRLLLSVWVDPSAEHTDTLNAFGCDWDKGFRFGRSKTLFYF